MQFAHALSVVARTLGVVALGLSLTHCAGLQPARGEALGRVVQARSQGEILAPFLPPPGRQLLIIGDNRSQTPDVAAWGGVPALVMGYTNLAGLTGITERGEIAGTPGFLDELMARYPHSALLLGLNVVNQLDAINRGKLDANIDRLIELLARYQRPVFVRFGYEVEGPWNHQDADDFRAAWLRFHARVKAHHADYIAMVWHTAADCGGTFGRRPLRDWYPGDEAVDWVGMSWFGPDRCEYKAVLNVAAFARAHDKPLMIPEATPRGFDISGLRYSNDGRRFAPVNPDDIWSAWFEPFFRFAHLNADVLRAVCYISANWDAGAIWGPPYNKGYWGDSRVRANPEIFAKWREEMAQPNWLKASPELFQTLGWR